MTRSRTLTAVAAALALTTASAQAQTSVGSDAPSPSAERPEMGGVLDQLTVGATQFGLAALRLFADVRYGDVEPLPGTGAVLVTDLTASIPVPYAPPRACTVTIGSFEGQQSALAFLTGLLGQQSLRMADVSIPLACLPPPARTTLQVAGLTSLAVDELRLSTSYDLPTAEADISLGLSVRDVADLELRGRLDYAFVRLDFSDVGESDDVGSAEEPEPEPVPAVEFGPIDVTLTDRGLSQRAVPFLRIAGLTPEQVPGIAGNGVRSALGPLPLADDLERELSRFLTEGGRVSIALRPDVLWLDELENATPSEIVEAFNPSVGNGTRPDLPDTALLAALASDELTDAQRLDAAAAFLSGAGLPRNPVRALELVEPLLEDDATAQALAAEAILADGGSADRAYGLALRAGASGADVGSVIRRAEALLEPGRIAEVQRIALANWDGATAYEVALDDAISAGDTLSILRAAKAYGSGELAVRSYEKALTYALLADAAGEVGARPLLDRIERQLTRDAATRTAWGDTVSRARDAATSLWISGGLASALASANE